MLYDTTIHIKSIVEVKISLLTGIVFVCVGIVGRTEDGWYANHILECLHDGFRFQNGPKPLSRLMRESMADDPVQPILWEPHLLALDRRVTFVLSAVADCIKMHAVHDVIFANDSPWIFQKKCNYLQLNVKSIGLWLLDSNSIAFDLEFDFFSEIIYENKKIHQIRARTKYLFIFSHLSHFHLAMAAISAYPYFALFIHSFLQHSEFTFVHSLEIAM